MIAQCERQIQSSTRINNFASGLLIPTFANVAPGWDANVRIRPLTSSGEQRGR
jgi:hypothetical protein